MNEKVQRPGLVKIVPLSAEVEAAVQKNVDAFLKDLDLLLGQEVSPPSVAGSDSPTRGE